MAYTHVYPINDLKEHNLEDTDQCWCKPSVEEFELTNEIVVVHHSADGRELAESKYLQ